MRCISTLAEKNKLASVKWNGLSPQEQKLWINKATEQKYVLPSHLDPATKQKLIDNHINLIAKEVQHTIKLHNTVHTYTVSNLH